MGSLLELTQRLIATPSPNPPGNERQIAEVVREEMRERGLPEPRIIAREEHRPNLLSTLDFGAGGRHLCLCGHLDTKPVGSAEWSVDPLQPTIRDGRLYGLGSCDMKGAVAAMIEAARELVERPPAVGRLSLLFTADEEMGARQGARYVAEMKALEADGVLIGEPAGIDSDWDRFHLVSRGITQFTVRVRGDQGHSSMSNLRHKVSATQQLAKLLVNFAEYFQPSAPEHWSMVRPTVNAGVTISGGVGFGVIPGEAEFAVDLRTMPGMELHTLARELQDFLDRMRAEEPDLRADLRFEPPPRDWLPPTEVARDDPLPNAVRLGMHEVLGVVPPDSVFPATTDAAWLQGFAGIPTLPACGPGLLERAHSKDEFVSIAALNQAKEIYGRVTKRFCTGA